MNYSDMKLIFYSVLTLTLLGAIPFTEELLRRGTNVILCANSKPILNDVTYAELVLLLAQV